MSFKTGCPSFVNLVFKTFGIRFVVNVHGTAGRFSVVPTLLNLGAGLALLSVSTLICDLVVLRCHPARTYYQDKKFLQVEGEDAWAGLEPRQQQ